MMCFLTTVLAQATTSDQPGGNPVAGFLVLCFIGFVLFQILKPKGWVLTRHSRDELRPR